MSPLSPAWAPAADDQRDHKDAVPACARLTFTKRRGEPLYISCLDTENGLNSFRLISERHEMLLWMDTVPAPWAVAHGGGWGHLVVDVLLGDRGGAGLLQPTAGGR